jgi:hypothetical protein
METISKNNRVMVQITFGQVCVHQILKYVSWPGVAIDEAGREGVARKLEVFSMMLSNYFALPLHMQSEFATVPVFLSAELEHGYWDMVRRANLHAGQPHTFSRSRALTCDVPRMRSCVGGGCCAL